MTKTALPALMSAKQINSKIDTIFGNVEKTATLIHETAVQCLLHAREHGDVTLLGRLIGGNKRDDDPDGKGMPTDTPLVKGYYVQGLRIWVSRYAPIVWGGGPKGSAGFIKKLPKKSTMYQKRLADVGGDESKLWDIQSALENPFYDLEEVRRVILRPAFTMDNVIKLVQGMVNRIDNAVERGQFEGDPEAAKELVQRMLQVEKPEEKPERIVHPKTAALEGEAKVEGAGNPELPPIVEGGEQTQAA